VRSSGRVLPPAPDTDIPMLVSAFLWALEEFLPDVGGGRWCGAGIRDR